MPGGHGGEAGLIGQCQPRSLLTICSRFRSESGTQTARPASGIVFTPATEMMIADFRPGFQEGETHRYDKSLQSDAIKATMAT